VGGSRFSLFTVFTVPVFTVPAVSVDLREETTLGTDPTTLQQNWLLAQSDVQRRGSALGGAERAGV
jgi:hypothetical protein